MDERWTTHRIRTDAGDAAAHADTLLLREWLLTNGTGGYAMGTAAGCNTSRYHGLLVAATRPPVARLMVLSQMWEQLILSPAGLPGVAEQTLDFSTLVFRNLHDAGHTFAPRGVALLTAFERGLSVRWTYRWGAIGFERELILHWKEPACTLRYRVTGLDDARMQARLRLQPMLTLRGFHGLRRHWADPRFQLDEHRREYFTVSDPANPLASVTFLSSHGDFEPNPHWWQNVFYPGEQARGQEDTEDLFVPCRLETPVGDAAVVEVTAALGDTPVDPHSDTLDRAHHLQPRVVSVWQDRDDEASRATAHALAIAADDFVVDRAIGSEACASTVAGYPWFTDWGRQTFIALPGLLLATGRLDEARSALRGFADAIHEGLVPHAFDEADDAAASYAAADTSLWYIRAALAYMHASGDAESWRQWLAAACLRIVDAYIVGTAHGIVMDTDGLITAGDPATALTWMDARHGETAVTPRFGKPVEVNALWYHALRGIVELLADRDLGGDHAERFADAAASCDKLAARVGKSFARAFWNPLAGCLHDRLELGIDGRWHGDPAIRPNQLFAVALPYSPLSPPRQKQVLAVVKQRLLTPLGLRTLVSTHPGYRGRNAGSLVERAEAVHNGSIFPWLLGPYAEAVLRVSRFTQRGRDEAAEALAPLRAMLEDADRPGVLGQLPEAFEPEPSDDPTGPTGGHRHVGAPAQACGVAELLRVGQLIRGG